MADQPQSTLRQIAQHLITAAKPLIDATSSLGAFIRFMARLGFSVSDIPAPYRDLASLVSDAVNAIENPPASPDSQYILGLLEKAKAIFQAAQNLKNAAPPTGADAQGYAAEIGERLFELLLTDYLAAELPAAYNVLSMMNVITTETVSRTATRNSYVRKHFNWEELPKIVSDPSGLPARVYNWGEPNFKDHLLLRHLGALGHFLGLPTSFRDSDSDALDGYLRTKSLFPRGQRSLVVPFYYANIGGKTIEAALAIQKLPGLNGAPPGLILEPQLPSQLPLSFPLGANSKFNLRAGTNLGELFGFTLQPPDKFGIVYPFAPDTPPPAAGVGLAFTYTPPTPLLLLGDTNSSRLELGSATVSLEADVNGAELSFGLGADLQGLKITIDPRQGDSFLQSILGSQPVSIEIPLGFQWDQKNGLRLKGSAAFEISLHPHLSLGPIKVQDADIKLAIAADGSSDVKLEIGAGISGNLGAFQFMLEGIGFTTTLSFAPGNAGPFGIDLGFKSPNGVGLSIDAGGFTGGGFLTLDPAKGEYSGGLELTFQGTISIRAIGILDTKTGAGSGFSLLVLVVTEFPPIQLSFGFTLLGVGGLLGLNRAVLLDQLQNGVRDGSLDSVLFPTNVVANAGRILGDLQRIFPTQDGLFLVGPMAKLGWGTPTLLTLELGLILDLPKPAFAIVGVLHLAAPTDDVAILDLKVSFVGSVDFEKGQLEFDASLFDSRVLNFTLTGDMAVRVFWKDNANFLLTIGGFNPSYTPPPMDLGKIARLGLVLFAGNPDVRAEAYFAVTSNTVQYGGQLEIKYGLDIFNVYGLVGFDVLISLNPFHFVSEISAQLAVRTGTDVLFSIKLQFTLEGPKPLHAHGTGSFEIGFIFTITFSVSFDVTIGDPLADLLAPFDVLGALVDALSNLGNWRPVLPPNSNQSVTLRSLPDPSKNLVLHPFGTLSISQKLCPLNIGIQRFGSSTPDKGTVFRITGVRLGNSTSDEPTTTTSDEFAPAQFFTMTDAEKLSRPSFSNYDSGVNIGGDLTPQTDWVRARQVTYEVIYVPEHAPKKMRYAIAQNLSRFSFAGAAASKSKLSAAQKASSPLVDRVTYQPEQYVVASSDDLTLHAADLVFATATAADQALKTLLAQKPELTGALQVLPTSALAA